MGLLDGIFGGGRGGADDPYADILTPAQRNQQLTQGLLAMAGAFAQAGMPSRIGPVPIGSAIGSAAAALGAGQESGMTAALANAYKAQQVRDLRAKAALQAKLNPLFQSILDQARNPASAAPIPGGPGAGAGAGAPAAPAAPAGDQPLMLPGLPYPEAPGGGLLGADAGAGGEYGAGQVATGLLGAAPPVAGGTSAGMTQQQQNDAAIAATGRPIFPPGTKFNSNGLAVSGDLSRTLPGQRSGANIPADVLSSFARTNALGAGSGGGLLGAGVGGGSSAADLGAGGDEDPNAWAGPQVGAARSGGARGGGTRGAPTPEINQLIEQAAAQYNVPPDVLRGLIQVESGFKPNIVSPAGAVGLAQLMPGTSRELGVTDPTDPTQAVPAGARYLRQGLDAHGGDINKALMYYHGGPNQQIWGPRTQAYPGAVLAAAGRPSTTEGSGGGLEPDPYASLTPRPAGGPLTPPGSLPALPAPGASPGAAPSLGAGGKIPGMNVTPQELAVIDAMAESAGLGNPFKGLLDTYYKSPGYLGDIKRQEKQIELESTGPITTATEAAKAPFIRQQMKERLGEERANALIQQGILQLPDGRLVAAPQDPGVLGQKEAATPTSEMKDYVAYTKDQQMRNQPAMSFFDWSIASKRAGAASTVLNTGEGFEAAQIKARIAVDQKTATEAGEKALAARQLMPLLDEALVIARKTPEGLAGPASAAFGRVAAAFGINVPSGSSNAELLGAINQRLIPLVREPGATAASEMDRYLAAGPALMGTADGRVKIAEMTKAMGQRAIEIAKVYRQHIGSPNLYEKLAELDKPLFTDDQRKAMEAASVRSGVYNPATGKVEYP